MTAVNSSTIAGSKAVIAAFFDSINQGAQDGSEGWVAYLSPQVIDHNKIIFGEADEPGAAIEGLVPTRACPRPPGVTSTWNRSGSSPLPTG
jgi:hypothetical protein